MAKFFGGIGYLTTKETKPGIWTKVVTEKKYSGELNRLSKRWSDSQKVNSDINLIAEISIVADPFLFDNLHNIKYVRLRGTPWNVESVDESQYPRLILSIGGIYNGEVAGDEQD